MIFAETPRLNLRKLERNDLPRLAELIGDWDVAKWLLVVPHPYHLKDAEEFFEKQNAYYASGIPEFFAIAGKENNLFMGGIGLHPAYINPQPDETVLGYWLGKPFWGQGFVSETVMPVIDIAFRRPEIKKIKAITDPANKISQNILRKAGLKYLGTFPRTEPGLRGPPDIMRWELTRENCERARS